MARIEKVIPPSQPTYLVELTQDEVDVLAGLAHDLSDGRTTYMVYPVDGDKSRPNERGLKALRGFADALVSTQGDEYDYFDYWQTVTEDELKEVHAVDGEPLRW